MVDKSHIIEKALAALSSKRQVAAAEIINDDYPFNPVERHNRNSSPYQSSKIFIRDGFIDRYSGKRLVFPPVLRLLSIRLPQVFPYHRNWKMDRCHIAFWELYPTLDHILPIARGGSDDESNLVCTSQLRNNAKSNWTLEEMGWELLKPGDFAKWDGLIQDFMDYVEKHQEALSESFIKRWYLAANRCLQS